VSRDNLHRKSEAAIPLGGEWGLAAVLFEQSAHLLDSSPVRKAFPAFAGTSFEHNLDKPLLHAFFDEALCVNIGISGVICGTTEAIIAKRK
jgi:hypothetical protein